MREGKNGMNIAIIGSTGYGSAELIRILEHHPYTNIASLVTSSQTGESMGRIFPHLSHLSYTLKELDVERLSEEVEAVFFAAPPGVSSQWAPRLAEEGLICIDLAGDFRLDASAYEEWYGKKAAPATWLKQAVYGLSEWKAEEIAQAHLVANPGCYPTAALLLLLPLLKEGVTEAGSLVIDAKSGVSGAGRGFKQTNHFCEVNENHFPYKVGIHQHTPEIERYASSIAGRDLKVLFTPQIVPMSRGILVTAYIPVTGWTSSQLMELLSESYREAPFVRVCRSGEWPGTKQVQGSNFCDLGIYVDERTKQAVGVAVIDNLMKGAAGQAVQNLNIRMGWPETSGLNLLPLYP